MFFKIDVLKNFANFTRKHVCWSLCLIKLHAKKAPTQVFSSEICEIFNNNYLEEHLQWLLLNYCIAFSAAG